MPLAFTNTEELLQRFMKIQITKDITFPNSTIPVIKQGTVLTLPHREEAKNYVLILEYQDRSFFFNTYISLYYNINNQMQGFPLQENKKYKVINNERGKISKLTQMEFVLQEPQAELL